MNKPMRSWMVPVSSFALAVVLAMVAGPKSRGSARFRRRHGRRRRCLRLRREELQLGHAGARRRHHRGRRVRLPIRHPRDEDQQLGGQHLQRAGDLPGDQCGGILATRTLDVSLDPKPKFFRVDEDIEETLKIRADWKGNAKDLDKALKGAEKQRCAAARRGSADPRRPAIRSSSSSTCTAGPPRRAAARSAPTT